MSSRVETIVIGDTTSLDEEVLASLELLWKKVAAQEKNRAQDERTIQQLRRENLIAQAKISRYESKPQSDIALRSTAGEIKQGNEVGSGQRKLPVEKNCLCSPPDRFK